jgi:hypothetical protein
LSTSTSRLLDPIARPWRFPTLQTVSQILSKKGQANKVLTSRLLDPIARPWSFPTLQTVSQILSKKGQANKVLNKKFLGVQNPFYKVTIQVGISSIKNG